MERREEKRRKNLPKSYEGKEKAITFAAAFEVMKGWGEELEVVITLKHRGIKILG